MPEPNKMVSLSLYMSTKSLQKIIFVGVSLELGLVIVYCLWALYRSTIYPLNITINTTFLGLLIPIPIIALNIVLFCSPLNHLKGLNASNRFINNVVKPFIDDLNVPAAITISAAAGIGEELFFRGLLQTEFGLVLSSLLFSVLHFGLAVKEFKFMAFLYFVIGLYFGWFLTLTNSLWALCVAHAAYDFIVIVYMKSYWDKRKVLA